MLHVDDIRQVLQRMGETVTDDEVVQLIKELDLDGDNRISFNEFQRMMHTV